VAFLINFKWEERNLYKLLPVLSALLDSIYVFSMLTFKMARTYENSKKWELYSIVFVFVSDSNFIIKALFLQWLTHFIGTI